jgi:hypothetical protein
MRDCVFILADGTMRAMFEGFLDRAHFSRRLKVGEFQLEATTDLIVAVGSRTDTSGFDSGLYSNARVWLDPLLGHYRHAIVVLDNDWDGSPGVVAIREKIRKDLVESGWHQDQIEVIVIDPELESWVWQDSVHVERAFRYRRDEISLRMRLQRDGWWDDGQPKPTRPKEAFESLKRELRLRPAAVVFNEIASSITVANCTDPAFQQLCTTLRRWFPTDDA